MAINQFAVGFLLVWGFSQADHLSGQADSLPLWARAERDTLWTRREGSAPFTAVWMQSGIISLLILLTTGLGFFCGAVAIYLGIFCRQMVNVVTFSPESRHSKNLSKAVLTHFLECFQLTSCSQIAGKCMCAKQSMKSDAHCSVSQETMLLLIGLQIYKEFKKKLKTKR